MAATNYSQFIFIDVGETPLLNSSSDYIASDYIASEELMDILLLINFVVLCKIIDVFGTVANIINIIVFVKIGFKDPVNISLLALAISDLGSCFSLIWLTICYNPLFQKLDLPFDPKDFHYLTSGWIHNTFTRITGCITAFIAFERCLCVAAPLKVKAIITPKTVTVFLSVITFVVTAIVSPIFYTARYVWKFFPERNKSILSLIFIENSAEIERVPLAIHSVFIPLASFFVIVVSTIILILTLRQNSKWRQSATTTSNSLSSRDAKVSKMVVMIAGVFIICFIPICVTFTTIVLVPEFGYHGQYKNIFLIMFSYHFVLESINSSLNIFVYYRMSSNYRAVFDQVFARFKKNKTDAVAVKS